MHDARIARGVAARHGEKRARAEAPQLRLPVELVLQAQLPREILQPAAVAAGIQGIRRQGGEPARDVVAGGGREGELEVGRRRPPPRRRCARAPARGFGLLLKVASRNAAASIAATLASNAASAAAARTPAATAAPTEVRTPCTVRASFPAVCSRSKALAWQGHTGDHQQRFGARSHPKMEAVALLADPGAEHSAQHAAVRQRRPIVGRWASAAGRRGLRG